MSNVRWKRIAVPKWTYSYRKTPGTTVFNVPSDEGIAIKSTYAFITCALRRMWGLTQVYLPTITPNSCAAGDRTQDHCMRLEPPITRRSIDNVKMFIFQRVNLVNEYSVCIYSYLLFFLTRYIFYYYLYVVLECILGRSITRCVVLFHLPRNTLWKSNWCGVEFFFFFVYIREGPIKMTVLYK